ncbi:MAG: TonB-dependent receptor, partial [Gammaproteobacteria bacterium]|nr:TonB-dependent receptor [Gammaproteobacteria bacterium]
AFALDNSRTTRSDKPGRDRQRSRGFAFTAEREGAVRVVSTSAVADADIVYSFDGDWGADPSYDFTSRFLRRHRAVTQDLRLLGGTPGEGFGWVAGFYGSRIDESNDQLDLYGGEVYRALVSDYRARTIAVYGSLERRIAARWQARLGLRAERRSIGYTDTDGTDLGPAEDMWGGQLTLEYRPGPAGFGYLTLARGYKGGGFNLGAVVPASRRFYEAEGLDSLEAGWKFEDAASRLRGDLALFHMWRRRQQVGTSVQVDPGDPLSFIYLTDNAARGVNYGFEASLEWRATEALALQATAGLLRARFTDYRSGARDLSGRDQAHAPRGQFGAGLDWRGPRGLRARADVRYADAFFFSDSHDQRATSCLLGSLRVGRETEAWSASLWVLNAFDRGCAQRGFFFGNEPPDYPDKLYVQKIDPRQAGFTVSWKVY